MLNLNLLPKLPGKVTIPEELNSAATSLAYSLLFILTPNPFTALIIKHPSALGHGIYNDPAIGSPLNNNPIEEAYIGRPFKKFRVPSNGSITQTVSEISASSFLSSSPTTS